MLVIRWNAGCEFFIVTGKRKGKAIFSNLIDFHVQMKTVHKEFFTPKRMPQPLQKKFSDIGRGEIEQKIFLPCLQLLQPAF